MAQQIASEEATIKVDNIGGIDTASATIQPGVTALTGRNATNRTSMLQAIMAACGSENVTLKGDADSGAVELTIGEETYTRKLEASGDTIQFSGDPYLEEITTADLFAFLLEANEARRAVALGQDLRELIMRPVDTDEIQEEINRLKRERRQIEDDIDELEQKKRRLPKLEEKRSTLKSEIEQKQEEYEAKKAELESAGASVEGKRQIKQELEEKIDDVHDRRDRLEALHDKIDTHEESINELREEQTELQSTYEDLREIPDRRLTEIEDEISTLRTQKDSIESEIRELQDLIEFNRGMLDGGKDDVISLNGATDDQDVTDQLLEADRTTCWTCGTTVDTNQIESTVEKLRESVTEKLDETRAIEDRIEELESEKDALRDQQREREQIETRLKNVEAEIENREETVATLEDERDSLTDEIERLEAEIDKLEQEEHSEILELHRTVNEFEFELKNKEDQLESTEADIEAIESTIDQQTRLIERRNELADQLEDLRTRIDRIEQETVENFNEHMENILGILEYANIERIWLERRTEEVREGRRKVSKSIFELHVVRQTATGTTYEDTVDHLSESEREVTGLMFALAGYLVHDVYEKLPFMLLDSVEAIDSDRIADLIDYFQDYATYLLVALLPEDSAALDEEYNRLTDI